VRKARYINTTTWATFKVIFWDYFSFNGNTIAKFKATPNSRNPKKKKKKKKKNPNWYLGYWNIKSLISKINSKIILLINNCFFLGAFEGLKTPLSQYNFFFFFFFFLLFFFFFFYFTWFFYHLIFLSKVLDSLVHE